MNRIPFPRPPACRGTTRRFETARGLGCRYSRARRVIPASLAAGLALLGCETRDPAERAGSGCEYRDIPGTCLFESITPSGANTYGQGFRTLFSFLPESEQEASQKDMRMIIGDGKDPTRRYLEENRIEVGSRVRCIRKLRVRGPCSPEVFVFPGLKNAY